MRLPSLLLAALGLTLIVVGCSAPADEDTGEGGADLSSGAGSKKFDVNHLLEDEDILGGANVTVAMVQSFLESKGSTLATYKEGGSSAAEIIVQRCKADGVNPVYMLARIQGESSLVGSKTSKNLAHATGCGCPDGKPCAKTKEGFERQITCAADLIKGYFDALDKKGETVSGYKVKKGLKTLDPCNVTPDNRATVALYTYTPWVGQYGQGCGSSKSMGSTGIAFIYSQYKDAFPAPAPEDTVAAADPETAGDDDDAPAETHASSN